MLYGPQGIFGGLTPSQRAAHERRREAAERLAKAARPSESVTLPAASGGAKRTDDAPEADAFFKSAWRLLDALDRQAPRSPPSDRGQSAKSRKASAPIIKSRWKT